MPTRVLIYDDNEALRLSIESLVNEQHDLQLLAAMPNAETVEVDIRELEPDVVLMDIDMPVVNGVEAVRRIRRINGQLPIIMLTVFDGRNTGRQSQCIERRRAHDRECGPQGIDDGAYRPQYRGRKNRSIHPRNADTAIAGSGLQL